MEKADLIWHNGELVAWEDATIHVLTHGLHYGTGVFEGERAYATERGPGIFRHRDHLRRLLQSAELYYMPVPYTLDELRSATHELLRANNLRECYIRPIIYRGYGQMGLNPLDCEVSVSIAAWPWGAYLGEESKLTGIRAKVSSWRRISADSLIPHAKASGQYLNSVLAKIEATKAGYQESILLNSHGHVCEGSGENIFVVKDGKILTPPQTAGILDGISRASILTIAGDRGYEVVERDLARAELFTADEVFMSGTAAELVPVREIDDHPIGEGTAGPVTRDLQGVFEAALHGREARYAEWLDVVEMPAGQAARAGVAGSGAG
ncbi:MAG: branched-chain amino acid aminotransferase [Solirubrobacteraceae bacterium]|nr:branched-chain amino acid aminotransferase [Solirubrobacteraceae bacterium]